MDHRAQAVAGLDVAAKVRLLTGATMFTLYGEPVVGLEPLALSDGPTGVRGLRFAGGPAACLLPNATLLAATWSPERLAEVGRLLAEEAQRQHIHVVLGPTINLHRSPLGGRLFEAYSEDPLLTGVLAAGYVRGVQAEGIGACLKHLVANESETDRNTVDIQVDEATLRELYLLPFEIAICDSDPWSVMAAYNEVNGRPATEQTHVMREVLKDEWGYAGLVMSDWFATKTAAPAVNAGLDLVMPGPDGPWGDALVDAVTAGEVPEATIDDAVRRLLHLADRVGALGQTRSWPVDLPGPAAPDRRRQLRELATDGMTVLTNDGVLPLAPVTRVALVGRHAIETLLMGGGSAQVNPPHQVSVARGLLEAMGDAVQVTDGVEVRTVPVPASLSAVSDPGDGTPGMRLRLTDADGAALLEEHVGEARRLIGFEDDLPRPATVATLTARVELEGALQVGVIGLGHWHLQVDGAARELDLAAAGADPGEAILKPPAATFAVTGPCLLEATVDLPPDGRSMVGLVARTAPRPDPDVIADAVATARGCEVAVVVVGLTEEQETEASDKTTLRLPGGQDALVEAVAAAAPRTVVVVNAATPVLMPWLDRVNAVLVVGLPGQEGGYAVADALLGVREPAGRLVTTYPAADGATPAWNVTPTGGVLRYGEGPFVGYRGHAAGLAPAPQFWFGHGLGYGSWDYLDAQPGPDGKLIATIRNTSGRTSREVVQVYLSPADGDQPVRLAGWAAATVAAGETAEVPVRCDPRAMRRWDAASGGWSALGPGELLVARGLGDVRLRLPTG